MKFITLEQNIIAKKRKPASYVRKRFCVSKKIKSATLRLTSLGVFIAYFNGQRLDEQVLTPGYTDYNYRLQYIEYNIFDKIKENNELFAIVGDGWYRGSVGIGSKINCYGTKTKFGCELIIEYFDGTVDIIEADESFEVSNNGPLRENDLKIREVYDANRDIVDWHSALQTSYNGNIIPQEAEAVLEHEHFEPQIIYTANGETVLDFGQNIAGYVHFKIANGIKGHTVKLTMGETLDENGNFTMKNLSAEGASLISGEVGQELIYTCKDGEQEYKPHFLVCGFRYVKVENWCEDIVAQNFIAIAVYSDLKFVGKFECSNGLINRLIDNVKWSLKSNFVDIPGDCPTRERAGWSADISIFCETACYLTNPQLFLRKWLKDFILEQGDDGTLPYVIPDGGYSKRQRSCCGWSDAISNVPTILYNFYGDIEQISLVYKSVKRFIEYQIKRATKKNILTRTKSSVYRKYIIERGFHYGEWLEPSRPMYKDFIKDLFYPDTEFTTAWFYYTTKQLACMANLLNEQEDYKTYQSLSERIKQAYFYYFLENGVVKSDRQCRYVRPLFMGLSDDKRIADMLNKKVCENDYKIGTGFHTTYKILSVLCDFGYIDTAYKVLENEQQPGWLYEITKGATTTWENWNGIDKFGVPRDSHNHYAPGAVVAWLFSYCAGIKPLKPGFKEILIKPYVGGTLTWAEAQYDSINGKILSRWDKIGNYYKFKIEIPNGTTARVELPNGHIESISCGTYEFQCEV